jgi:alkanesulfonate monooxygenase SsuD/methylene tetrahydromethanopterin reductase-like flavin-dependent oxidoreductase (luciferase family)
VSDDPLRFGAALLDLHDIAREAATLEDLGYDLVSSGEHVAFNGPVGNGFVSLAVAAGATTSIRLMSAITLAPLYPAALLAKLGAALDVASGGRFELGVGVGGEGPAEFEACGVSLHERGARCDEALDVLRLLWSGDRFDHDGSWTTFHDIAIDPPPIQPGGPPIWVSGRADAAKRRAARAAVGFLPYMRTPDQLAADYAEVDVLAERPVRRGLLVWTSIDADGARATDMGVRALEAAYAQDFSVLGPRYCLFGDPDQVNERLRAFVTSGARTILFVIAGDEAHRGRARQLLADEVLPTFERDGRTAA